MELETGRSLRGPGAQRAEEARAEAFLDRSEIVTGESEEDFFVEVRGQRGNAFGLDGRTRLDLPVVEVGVPVRWTSRSACEGLHVVMDIRVCSLSDRILHRK